MRSSIDRRPGIAPARFAAWVGIALLPSLGADRLAAQAPEHVYLTWRGNTSTTMTVNAQTLRAVADVEVRFDTASRRGAPAEYRNVIGGEAHQIEGLADGRWVHWIDLTGLEPGRRYWFVVGSEEHGFSAERSFRTLPDDDGSIRFVAGGDLGIGPVVRDLQAHAAARRPQFAVIGGDLAYANGVLEEVADWDAWFDQREEAMVTPEGESSGLRCREDYAFIATLGAVDVGEESVGWVLGDAMAQLGPGESVTRTIELSVDRPSGPVQVRADLDVNAPAGRVYARVAETVGFDAAATASRIGSGGASVTLDGSVGEWAAWPWEIVEPAPREDGPPMEWDGVADASARVDFRVDGEDLIVAVNITDDRLTPHAGNDWDESDGIVLWIDEAPDGEYDNEPYMAIALPTEPGVVDVIVTDQDWEVLVEGSQAWATTTEDGWSAEFRIPLRLVGDPDEPAAIPEAVRMNVGIVDVDRAGQEVEDVILRRPEWELEWDYPAAGLIRVR